VWNNANKKNVNYLQKDLSYATLFATNPTCTSLGLYIGLCGERLLSKKLSDGMDVDLSGISIMDINSNVVSE